MLMLSRERRSERLPVNFGLVAVAAPLLLAQLAYTPGRDVDGPVSESVSACVGEAGGHLMTTSTVIAAAAPVGSETRLIARVCETKGPTNGHLWR